MPTFSDEQQPFPDPSAPPAEDDSGSGRLWVDGEFTLRIWEGRSDRVVRIRRPFALLGRIPGSDVRIEDQAVSARHVYLHLDRRGVFGVDLATRTGTRFGEAGLASGWLVPGQAFEVAGRRVELLDARADGEEPRPSSPPSDPLTSATGAPLLGVTLRAIHARHVPRALGSELVFVGRGGSCGVRVEGATASRVHCVLVRTAAAAFVVDLIGRGTWLNARLVKGAEALTDGDILMIGSARFNVHLTRATELMLARRPAAHPPELASLPGWPAMPGWPATTGEGSVPPLPPGLLPAGAPPLPSTMPPEAQGAILAWMMGALQAGQTEALRRQGEFHLALTRLIQQMQRDQATLLTEHLDRMESIDRELAELRGEIFRRFGSSQAASAVALPTPAAPAAEVPPSFRVGPVPKPPDADSTAAATWLINRVSQLEEEQRTTWKDMVSRLTGGRPR
jgi:pSer/pThr/pTyr-binding forkhead associated (FHA) protein